MSGDATTLQSLAQPAVAIVAAIIVSAANYLVQKWRFRIDRLSVAVDHYCAEINAVADLATEYWLLDRSDNNQSSTAATLEPKLVGRQIRLSSDFLALKAIDADVVYSDVEVQFPDLYDAMTGGNFGALRGEADRNRARSVQACAAELNGALRLALAMRSRAWVGATVLWRMKLASMLLAAAMVGAAITWCLVNRSP